jgi:Nuclease-related domain
VEPADISDRRAASLLLGGLSPLFPNIRSVIADGGHQSRRLTRELLKQAGWTLFIDDAHDLHSKTLIDLKRLIEVVRDSGGLLSVVLEPYGNIDHVLVAPTGVYAVETKARRKRKTPEGNRDNEVVFDGEKLQFPEATDLSSLHQTRQQADRLRGLFKQRCRRISGGPGNPDFSRLVCYQSR